MLHSHHPYLTSGHGHPSSQKETLYLPIRLFPSPWQSLYTFCLYAIACSGVRLSHGYAGVDVPVGHSNRMSSRSLDIRVCTSIQKKMEKYRRGWRSQAWEQHLKSEMSASQFLSQPTNPALLPPFLFWPLALMTIYPSTTTTTHPPVCHSGSGLDYRHF